MSEQGTIYDSSVADGRFQIENLALRWALAGLYAAFAFTGVIDVDLPWFLASEGFVVAFHIYYTWCVWQEFNRAPLPDWLAYTTPFVDTVTVSLVLVAVGDPLHPIWAVYFLIMVDNALFYPSIARLYTFWLAGCYSLVGLGVSVRGIDVHVPYLIVAGVLLIAGVYNFVTYISSEWRLRRRLTIVAKTDPLTNLLNRRGLEEALGQHLEAAAEKGRSLALLMIDVDRFKRYNDRYGHLAADGVLEQLAELLSAAIHGSRLVGRYGGDEFVMIVPGVAAEDALRLAERLCQQIARVGLCTVSIGVSVSRADSAGAKELLDLADAALLEAKRAGRNCVRALLPERAQAA